jgi:hypothetical protein
VDRDAEVTKHQSRMKTTRTRQPAATTVEAFIERRVLPEYRGIVSMLRTAMREDAKSEEALTYGILAFRRNRIIAVISPTKKGITLAFSRGAEFEDKYGLLEGVGKVSKNIRLSDAAEITRPKLRYYIKQAVTLDR